MKHAPDNPRARRTDRVLVRIGAVFTNVVYPLVAVVVLAFILADLPGLVRLSRDEGVLGTFTLVRKECKPWYEKGGCSYHGDFVSADGSVQLTGVVFLGNHGEAGDRFPAQYDGSVEEPAIYPLGSDEWKFAVAGGLAVVGYLGYRGWRLVRWVRRRRATSAKGG